MMKRPWGRMWKLFHTKHTWLKVIYVHGRTSLQAHRHRSEWHLGFYKVKPMEKHRLLPGLYIEFIKGKVASEDDIIRYDDDYGRSSPEPKTVMVSGGFDPIHVGHLRMFKAARNLGDRLIVVLNSDEWLKRKKGKSFMKQDERAEIIGEFDFVDEVFVLESERDDVCEALEKFKPDIFANGGDRRNVNDIPEAKTCEELGIEMVFNVGGDKVRSSSELLADYNK
jgi:cytidyltransferase-like protein